MLDLIAVLLALGLLMYLAFRGISLLILAPVMAMLAVALTARLPPLVPSAAYTPVFMGATGGFIVAFFPLFLLGAVFGKLMDDSGAARAIAQAVISKLGPERAILAVVLCCAVLTYGGVSLFVVAFAIFPIAAALFRGAAIPKRLIPGTLALGAFTFTMSALPGTPAIQNAIPMLRVARQIHQFLRIRRKIIQLFRFAWNKRPDVFVVAIHQRNPPGNGSSHVHLTLRC